MDKDKDIIVCVPGNYMSNISEKIIWLKNKNGIFFYRTEVMYLRQI